MCVFRPSAHFPLPVEEKAREPSKTRVFEPCDCHFPVPVEEKARAEEVGLSLGAGRGKGQRPAELKENPVLLDLTGNLHRPRTR